MLHIEWWHHAAYGCIWQLAAFGFAWEYLRRNDDVAWHLTVRFRPLRPVTSLGSHIGC
ncbi:transcriptional regulator domain-containing protein [Rhizobium jaguaris]|uniref:transcriptional regulator domain-containing protein n=1 Tax=Rhizobium jaguaris TaxID=1312183 RepID=UPI0026B85E39